MFNHHHLHMQRAEISATLHQHEHRAPTDESVRLLKEMEEAARQRVVETLTLENNALKAVVHKHDDWLSRRYVYHIHYEVNGRRRECCIDIAQDARLSREDVLRQLYRALADDMALFLLPKDLKI